MRSPLTVNRTGVQGYLFSIPPGAGKFLLDHVNETLPNIHGVGAADHNISTAIGFSDIGATEKKAIIQSRVGQGKFRDLLIEYWSGTCAITGTTSRPMLRASHIKPWRDSNNAERLDPFNGLLLAPSHDAAFDAGLISFADTGSMLVSSEISEDQLLRIGINPTATLRKTERLHFSYLEHHRSHVFKK